MQQTNVPFKVALGYIIVAIVLILAIGLVYRNTTTVLAINQATRDYIEKRQAADSTMSNLLKEEQTNLQQLTCAMQGKSAHNYLHEKMNSLNSGEDSVVVHSKAPKTHVAKNTTVEVMKTRKGFFRRLWSRVSLVAGESVAPGAVERLDLQARVTSLRGEAR